MELPAGVFDLNLTGSNDVWYEDEGQTADMDINDALSVSGAGMNSTVLATTLGQAERAFDIHNADVSISGLTIQGLFAVAPLDCGKAIHNSGSGNLTLDHVALIGNVMRGDGGAVCNEGGSLTVTDSVISRNCACFSGRGGGIYGTGVTTLLRVTMSENHAESMDGGAIEGEVVAVADSAIVNNYTASPFGSRRGGGLSAASLVMTNVTVNGNRAGLPELDILPTDSRGGGIFIGEQGTLTNVTLVGNQSGLHGGGIAAAEGAQVTVVNSIIFGNDGDDCFGSITSGGNNLAGDRSCNFNANGDLDATDPLLGPLLPVSNTYANPPLAGSPAIESGNPALCPAADQRAISRPQGPVCDRGAYEVIGSEPGDVDCDGHVAAMDALGLLVALADVRGANCVSSGDINGDHSLDTRDVLGILARL